MGSQNAAIWENPQTRVLQAGMVTDANDIENRLIWNEKVVASDDGSLTRGFWNKSSSRTLLPAGKTPR